MGRFPFPDLFTAVGEILPVQYAPIEQGPAVSATRPRVVPMLETIREPGRNNALFDVNRWWAYSQDRGRDLQAWLRRVNDQCPPPQRAVSRSAGSAGCRHQRKRKQSAVTRGGGAFRVHGPGRFRRGPGWAPSAGPRPAARPSPPLNEGRHRSPGDSRHHRMAGGTDRWPRSRPRRVSRATKSLNEGRGHSRSARLPRLRQTGTSVSTVQGGAHAGHLNRYRRRSARVPTQPRCTGGE